MKRLLILFIALCLAIPLQAQVFTIIELLLNSASAESDAEFTIFLFILSEADESLLGEFGRTEQEYTVFAPSDEAFRTFLDANNLTLRALMDDADLLQELLHYHIVEDSHSFASLTDLESITTLAGSDISITFDNDLIQLNESAKIIIENNPARNGVLHVIDHVLVSPNLVEVLNIVEMTAEAEATEASGD